MISSYWARCAIMAVIYLVGILVGVLLTREAEGNRLKETANLEMKLKAVKNHLESYPDEKNDKKYCVERKYPSTAGPRFFNSVLFLTHLETWYKQLKEILEVEN